MTEEKHEEFVLEDWVREGLRGFEQCTKTLFSDEFRKHMRAASKETLLAYRSLIDAALERIEEKPKKKRTKIKVE